MFKFPSQKIIAFEGLDCSFKETNHKEFVRRLTEESLLYCKDKANVISESFPRYGNWSTAGVTKWLNGELCRAHLKDFPEAVDCLYSIDRLGYWFEISPNGAKNIDLLHNTNTHCFVFDRYNLSNALYNPLSKYDTTLDDIMFDNDAFGIPNADIIVWMRMSDFDVLTNLIAKKKDKDANELDIKFLRDVWERSERLINSDLLQTAGINLIVIDCFNEDKTIKTKEELADEVWNKVMELI